MVDDRKALGHRGEQAAADFLKARGMAILATNYRSRTAEIDIIAQEGDTLCFIEVKTRRTLAKGRPGEAVTPLKQKKIILGALSYLKQNRQTSSRIRFDVIEVLEQRGRLDICLIPNAFQAL